MDSLNDLVWTDEEESDVLLKAIEGGPGMVQVCHISIDSCSSDGSLTPPFTAGMYGPANGCGC